MFAKRVLKPPPIHEESKNMFGFWIKQKMWEKIVFIHSVKTSFGVTSFGQTDYS